MVAPFLSFGATEGENKGADMSKRIKIKTVAGNYYDSLWDGKIFKTNEKGVLRIILGGRNVMVKTSELKPYMDKEQLNLLRTKPNTENKVRKVLLDEAYKKERNKKIYQKRRETINAKKENKSKK